MTITMTRLALDIVRDVLPNDIDVYPYTGTKVEGGGLFVEVLDAGPSGIPQPGRFLTRRVRINVLSDRTRVEGLPVRDDADSRAWSTWEHIDRALHDITHDRTVFASCTRADGPTLLTLPDADGAILLAATYEVTT